MTACNKIPPPTPTPTLVNLPTMTLPNPTLTVRPTEAVLSTQTPVCIDNLSFVDDATIPDGTIVSPGSTLDKQWLVQNSGTCNWDGRYRLRFVSGDLLGALSEYSLYPARSGTQANLRISFIAPQEAGIYVSEWQAFNAQGIPFGDAFFIKFEVQP